MRNQHKTVVTFVSDSALHVSDEPWAFAIRNVDEIERYWAQCRERNPHFFNGVVFVMAEWTLHDGAFEASFYRSDFKSFLYWRDHGYVAAKAFDAFGSALVRASDGRVLLGRQARGHINAGRAYLPGGFIDQRDCDASGSIDIVGSVRRELAEETGLGPADITLRAGLLIVTTGCQVALCVLFDAAKTSMELQEQVEQFLSADPDPELASVVLVGPLTDLGPLDVPQYTRLALEHQFGLRPNV